VLGFQAVRLIPMHMSVSVEEEKDVWTMFFRYPCMRWLLQQYLFNRIDASTSRQVVN
jgi:hypothetical protein